MNPFMHWFLFSGNVTCFCRIHCTHSDEYEIKKVPSSSCQDTVHEEISLGGFKISGTASNMLGRCFIEVVLQQPITNRMWT